MKEETHHKQKGQNDMFKLTKAAKENLMNYGYYDGRIYFYTKNGNMIRRYTKWNNGMVKELNHMMSVKW